ncbi:HAMP domain-containing sensor histidine kinase [Alkalimonas collagenimarina]|uniref:histidine kinase n=1 Tax=Alkalimonas collagenimarina TaxID=400390 RepID=A0ABT9H2C7_9GAMM|nr:HAMP domain-containing sensor histidine kinase [Alkalimonas collagenimarina]MDP4537468.1 HAMP domain-containing sensor histidine kinase [Alkalimonas collagenimarina]
MDLNKFLSELQSLSPEKQIEGLKALREAATPEQKQLLKHAAENTGNSWFKSALLEITNSGKHVSDIELSQPHGTGDVFDIEAVKSDAISDSIGQMLHELEPIIGSIRVFAEKDIVNFFQSKTCGELEKLNGVLETFESWRRVEQNQPSKEVNIYEEIVKEVDRISQKSQVGIHIDIPKDLVFVLPPSLLRIIISNALRNAVESSNQPTVREKQSIMITGNCNDKFMWFTIIDDGLGLQSKTEVLLKSRHTTKAGNRGLGLAIVDKAVRSMGGNWTLTNSKPYGAEFYFEIPVRE